MITKSKNFKVFSIMFCLLAIIVVSSTVHAAEVSDEKNIGVSFMPPSDDSGSNVTPYSTSKPSKVWNVKTDGQYDFSGWSYHETLYTNYKFTGKTSYKIYVKNTGSNTITVKAKTSLKTYASTSVGAGKTATIDLSGMDKDKEFYISFSSDNDYTFSGYIK